MRRLALFVVTALQKLVVLVAIAAAGAIVVLSCKAAIATSPTSSSVSRTTASPTTRSNDMQTIYSLDAETFAKLEGVLDALYGHGEILTADARRDLAHRLGLVRDTIRSCAERPLDTPLHLDHGLDDYRHRVVPGLIV